MMKRLQTIGLLAAAGALLALPAAGQAEKPSDVPRGKAKGHAKAKTKTNSRCVVRKGFVVRGTFVNYTPDAPAPPNVNEESVTLTVTGQNRHARRAGLTDASGSTAGLQYRLNDADDAFSLRLAGYEANETPSSADGDTVKVIGKVAVTKKKCAPANATLEQRYGDVDVRKVTITDAD